ncbi:hypothetical protein BDV95DRAFT_489991 [Massariosphaeria phaeospora]|uniref:Rhodopsin domain-containing protein n=1 Tax=Massariosphaeria phaeospora TaxID=100035 RepID=A0A7C8I8D8_9PLEO|nr:hypothetical protein BDV95DRAFT_489991 [Massariosphaeria phaeospora]
MSSVDPSKTPLLPNLSGAKSNFENPPSLLAAQTGTGIALIVVSAVLLAIRLSTNKKLHRKLCLDDWLCLIAFAGGIGYWAVYNVVSRWGTARHAWDVPVTTMTVSMIQMQVAIRFLVAPALWAAKAAILALYIRIFGTITWLRRTAYFWIVFMALFYGMNIAIAGVYCIPRNDEAWEGAAFARCSTSAWLNVVVGVFSCLADLLILILPFPIVMRLHISLAKKVSLGIVFGTGLLLVVLSIISLYLRVIVFGGTDPTWNGTILGIITVAEIFGTIAVSCAPSMSSFWLNILIKSTIWSELKSSFVFSWKSQPSKQNLADIQQNDSTYILRETTYEVLEDGASRKSSNHQTHDPVSTKHR